MFDKLASTGRCDVRSCQPNGSTRRSERLGAAELQSDPAEYRKQAKMLSDIEPLVERFREYKTVTRDIAQTEELVAGADADMRELAQQELKSLILRRDALVGELKILLVPQDPNDEKDVVLEIRAGTGGDEAALFAAELFRMYSKFAERQGWRMELMSSSDTGAGGLKEVIATIEGRGVYSKLEVRERRSPRAARARDRGEWPDPYVDGDGRRAAGSGGSGHSDQREGPARRYLLLERVPAVRA